ncbi:neocarzinostatin apoprotein domain-containing protein [Nocardia sp. NPDC055321]
MIRPAIARALTVLAVVAGASWQPSLAAADSGAAITISVDTDLTEGQRITVDGRGFRPGLAAVAVGLCKQGFTSGIKHCDLEGGATFVNISGDGTFPTVTLTAHQRFHDIDCGTQPCVIAAAPLPGSEPAAVIEANSAQLAVVFQGTRPPAAALPAPATSRDDDVSGPSTPLWTATAVLLALVSAIAIADRRRSRTSPEEK